MTGSANLRPLTLAELLDQAVRLYRKNFLTFVGIIAIVQVPLTAISLLVSLFTNGEAVARLAGDAPVDPSSIFTPTYFLGQLATIFLGILSLVLVSGVATAALTRAVADNYLGESVNILDAYKKIGRTWLKLVFALVLAVIFTLFLGIWFIVPCVGWLTGLGMIAFFSAVITPLIAPVLVLENQSVSGVIRRAWDLARRRFWWVVGFVFILFLFGQLIVTGPTTLATLVLQFLFGNPVLADDPATAFTLQTIIQSIVSLVFSLIYIPFQLTNMTLMYFDLRVRTEGFDLALLAGAAAGNEGGASQAVSQAPQARGGGLVTMTEMGYFALLSIGAGALWFVFVFVLAGIGAAIGLASAGF